MSLFNSFSVLTLCAGFGSESKTPSKLLANSETGGIGQETQKGDLKSENGLLSAQEFVPKDGLTTDNKTILPSSQDSQTDPGGAKKLEDITRAESKFIRLSDSEFILVDRPGEM